MKIHPLQTQSVVFQRAYSSNEKKEYKKLTEDARKELDIQDTAAIIFDFNMPSKSGCNAAIGSLNSDENLKFINFLKEMTGLTRIQTGPQSELEYNSNGKTFTPTTSPYSGATFSIGKHTIALEKLAKDEYGNLLDEEFIHSLDKNYQGDKVTREYKTDYEYALGKNKDGAIFIGLKKAYETLKENPKNAVNKEFLEYKKNIDSDIEKDILFEAISNDYHKKGKNGSDINAWDEKDRAFFKQTKKYQKQRKEELKDEIDFLTFCQFIAEKQHLETKKELNENGIKLTGDCLVCFSQKEVWGNEDCFLKGWYTGGIDPFCPETNNIQPWGAPALDYDKLGEFEKGTGNIIKLGKSGELLYRKFKHFDRLYDGVRMDAFWQYVSPFVYNSALEGKNIEDIGKKVIKIMEKAVNDNGERAFDPDNYILELVGYNTEKGKELTKNIFPHVYSTAYAEYNENPKDLIEKQNYIDGEFIIGATSHDNDSLVNMSRNLERRASHTRLLRAGLKDGFKHVTYKAPSYRTKSKKEKIEQNFRTAKAAEIFTAKKNYYTLPDLFGMEERINISGKVDPTNWSVRIPNDYEKFYYSQAVMGYAMNIPKCYEMALYAKGCKDKNLISKLNEAAEILAEKGPLTTKEADKLEKEGKLGKTLNYSA